MKFVYFLFHTSYKLQNNAKIGAFYHFNWLVKFSALQETLMQVVKAKESVNTSLLSFISVVPHGDFFVLVWDWNP